MTEGVLSPRVSVLGPQDGELLLPVRSCIACSRTAAPQKVVWGLSSVGCRPAGAVLRSTSTALTTSPSSSSPATSAFRSGPTEHVLGPGSTFVAGMGTPHTFGNADPDQPASLLLTVTPERYIGYFRDLQDLRPGPDGMLVPAEILALMARYKTEPFSPS